MGTKDNVMLTDQIAYLERRNEYTLSPRDPRNSTEAIEAAMLATLRAHSALLSQNERLAKACDAAMQCIGELSPTQARVEVAQLLQAALSANHHPDADLTAPLQASIGIAKERNELRVALANLLDAVADTMRSHEKELECCSVTRVRMIEARALLPSAGVKP